jgi:hypothetical protein
VRRLIDGIRRELSAFIEQRDDLLCLLACSDDDAAVVLKILGDLEQAADSDVFLLFTDDFLQASPYVSVAVERLAEQHRTACDWAADNGREPLAPMPPELFDEARPATYRLFDAITFAKSLVPAQGGHRLVWTMSPSAILERDEYLDLVQSLLPQQGPEPWMRGLRLIFRVEPGIDSIAPEIAQCPRVRILPIDLGPEAIHDSLLDEAEDGDLPEEQRMQAMLSLALLDSAHDRTADAARRLEALLSYYQRTENVAMQAFVINAFGDVHRKAEDPATAQHWYECASVPAAQSKDPVILATVVKNLGDVAYERGNFVDAESYYVELDRLAAHLLQPDMKATALEWQGLSQEQQGAVDEAMVSWRAAATVCRATDLTEALRSNLTHLQRAYRQAGMGGPLAEVNAELRALDSEEGA